MEITIERLKMLKLNSFFEREQTFEEKQKRLRFFYFKSGGEQYLIHYHETCRIAFDYSNTIKYVHITYGEVRHHFESNLFSDMLDFVEYLKLRVGYGKGKNQSNIFRKLLITEFIEDPENI